MQEHQLASTNKDTQEWVLPVLVRDGSSVLMRLDFSASYILDWDSLSDTVRGPLEFHSPTDPWWPNGYLLCLSEEARLTGAPFTTAFTIKGRLVGLYGSIGIVRWPGYTTNANSSPVALKPRQALNFKSLLQEHCVLGSDMKRFGY